MSELVSGIYPKKKHPKAPDFVLCKVSINLPQFAEWARQFKAENPGEEWLNLDLKVSRNGKGYAALDDWKPSQDRQADEPDTGVPF